MSQRVPCPQSSDVGETKRQLQELLTQALNLADLSGVPPEIGARIQEVIDLTEACLGASDETG